MTDLLERPLGRVGVFSPGVARIPHLAAFLGAESVVYRPDLARRTVDAVVGWGRKPNTLDAYRFALGRGCPYYFLEDGFLRSVRPGVTGEPPLSLVVDDVGIYYDATRPSRLELLLNGTDSADPLEDAELLETAKAAMDAIRRFGLSKYNHAPDVDLGPSQRARVLVVDQTAGDLSVRLGCCVAGGLENMLEQAVGENPGAEILVKAHPDVMLGRKAGYLARVARDARVRVLSDPVSPQSLLRQVDRVYVATSLLGFEALLAGCQVTCFGVPFYAGWGLTDDRVFAPRRQRERSLEQVFAAAYVRYARYVDPETGARCSLQRVIDHLALQRSLGEANAGHIVVLGMSSWKRGFVPAFLQSPRNTIRFVRDASAAEPHLSQPDSKLVVWGTRESTEVRALAERTGAPIWRMEDGFLRSVGLGSDLYSPASLVVDRVGIYYDPTSPSELEHILQTARFTDDELARASRLRQAIVRHGISKYNTGSSRQVGPPPDDTRRVVLVIGQVEDDASIQLACPVVRTNRDLLRRARDERPDDYIVFKPHPDVVSGNRVGAVPDLEANRWCQQVVEDATLAACLDVADEVHTLSSLVGFEALLRGIPVFVYGQPFYAGWGLTEDAMPHPRRNRRVSLDELVAAALIRYPRYVSQRTGAFTSPEVIVDQLRRERARGGRLVTIRSSWPARQARKIANLLKAFVHAP